MPYKAIILDVDGTLVAHGEPSARPAVAEMVRRVQALGVKVVIATGRTYYAMNTSILGGIKPDYAVCANGAQVLDDAGRLLASGDFTPEEMYALVDYFEDFDYPLAFAFSDSYYVYVEFEKMREFYKAVTGHSEFVLDGEDQERHLQDMPFGAFGILPPEAVEGFQARYGHLGLQFVPYHPGYYDINRAGVNKAVGVKKLMELTGWKAEELLSMGDNENDIPLMQLVGRSYCMANGTEAAKAAASAIAPPVTEAGVAAAGAAVRCRNAPNGGAKAGADPAKRPRPLGRAGKLHRHRRVGRIHQGPGAGGPGRPFGKSACGGGVLQRGSGLPPLRKDAAPGERHRRRAPAQHQPRQRRLRHGKAGRRLGRGAGALAFVSALI